jgi:DMSO/TMAO reductase YedYZ molybdopterin-dependent catalytic subunit
MEGLSSKLSLFYLISMSQKEGDAKELPPNQKAIGRLLRWGKDHPGISRSIPKLDLDRWELSVGGEVERETRFNWGEFVKLPMVETISDFHCVEGWSVLNCKWEGVRFKTIMDLVRPRENAKAATFSCADGYTTSLWLEELSGDDVVLAIRLNGEPLEEGFGKPMRLVVPSKYAYKSAMWVTGIRFTATKEAGFWEARGYSDSADVWEDDRYSF